MLPSRPCDLTELCVFVIVLSKYHVNLHWRHNPKPICGTTISKLILVVQMLHETLAGRVMIHNGHVFQLERVQHCYVYLDQSLVLPQRRRIPGVQTHFKSDWLKVATRKRSIISILIWFANQISHLASLASQLLLARPTSNKFLRYVSHKLRHPISVAMYQPLKAVAVNWTPPQSNSMFETAGRAYQRSSIAPNQSNLQETFRVQLSQ